MISQKLIIIILAVVLSVVLVWFVAIDNYIIPSIVSGNQLSFQNGYETGTQDVVLGIIQQSVQCQQVTVWGNNNTVQLIDVACLQPNHSDISNP